MTSTDWKMYYRSITRDFKELKEQYPFANLHILPTVKPEEAIITVVAASKELIEKVNAKEKDFLGQYSRELYVRIPTNYKEIGCDVYGAKWLQIEKIRPQDIHLHNGKKLTEYGYKLCVGVPESFARMNNVILENVKTAENMLIAYEQIMKGKSERLELIAYEHGERGRRQYIYSKNKYVSLR